MTAEHNSKSGWPVLRIMGLTVIFLLIFAATTGAIAYCFSLYQGTPITPRETMYSSIVAFAILLIVARFHIKNASVRMHYSDRDSFLEKLTTQLSRLGYELQGDTGAKITFLPGFQSYLFGGGISVEMDSGTAVAQGPKVYVERLQGMLRTQAFLDPLKKSLDAARKSKA